MKHIIIVIVTGIIVRAYDIRSVPRYKLRQGFTRILTVTNPALYLQPSGYQKQCYVNNIITECPIYAPDFSRSIVSNINRNVLKTSLEQQLHDSLNSVVGRTAQTTSQTGPSPAFRRAINQIPAFNLNMHQSGKKLNGYDPSQNTGRPMSNGLISTSNQLNFEQGTLPKNHNLLLSLKRPTPKDSLNLEIATASPDFLSSTHEIMQVIPVFEKFAQSLDNFEQKFYMITFSKLNSISPMSRRENGMSYVQSGLFLHLALMALSTEVDTEARREIVECLGLHASVKETIGLINATVSSLPVSSEDLKFRWSTRLMLRSQNISDQFRTKVAPALQIQIDRFNGTETPKEMAMTLNHMVEVDSGGAIHSTFEEEDLSENVRSVLITTLYLRARWRTAPTLLNGTHLFHDTDLATRTVRMIRVNDLMGYADLVDLDAEALQIHYSTPGLSLLMLVPRGNSLRRLADAAANTNLGVITGMMQTVRVAATLPLYTLRMTLLLPNKLEAMNISRLLHPNELPDGSFRLTLAVQRIMFWAEAGRNAFKDDGVEWDETPQRELIVDRPYIFYVRWKNKTLISGNFVL